MTALGTLILRQAVAIFHWGDEAYPEAQGESEVSCGSFHPQPHFPPPTGVQGTTESPQVSEEEAETAESQLIGPKVTGSVCHRA